MLHYIIADSVPGVHGPQEELRVSVRPWYLPTMCGQDNRVPHLQEACREENHSI